MKKTILHIIDSLKIGGAEVLLQGIVTSMPDYDHVIILLYPENHFKEELVGIPIYVINYKTKLDLLSARRDIRRIIKKHHVDLIHSHLLTATFVARFSSPKNIPFFFSVHNVLSQSAFTKFKSSHWVEKLFYKKNQDVIFVSNNARVDYDEWIGIKGNEYILPNYIGDEFFSSEYRKTDFSNKPTIRLVAVGVLKDQKNFLFLIQSLKKFERNFILDIYGEGPQREELMQLISTLNLKDSVRLPGFRKDIYKVLGQYDIFLMPSKFEGFGISMMEAMAIGLPVLASAIPTLKAISGDSCFFFEPENERDLVNKLLFMLDSGTLETQSENARKRAEEISGKDSYLRRLKSIYNSKWD